MSHPSIFRDGLLEGLVCLVTGGGTGIGRAIAAEFCALGATVHIGGRREDPLAETRDSFRAQGWNVTTGTCDIRDAESIAAWSQPIRDEFGRVDVLINNAGGQFPSPAASLSPRGFEAVIRNNLLGTWNVTHHIATECMIPNRRGHIVNITADVRNGFPGMAHTGAARAGVENLTRTLAIEWAEHGIRVNAVAPGVIFTEALKQYPESLLENSIRATPLRRLAAPEEVSHLVTYLASPYSDFVTGQCFRIDGGKSLWGESWPISESVPDRQPYPGRGLGPKA